MNCTPKIKIRKFVAFSPTVIFLTIFLGFQFIPGIYMYIFNIQENLYFEVRNYSEATLLYVISVALFISTVAFVRYIVWPGDVFFKKTFFNSLNTVKIYTKHKKMLALPNGFVIFSIISVSLYFAMGGYEKLLKLGTGIDVWEYRLIGYDDRPRILTAILEISRRVFLPVALLYYLILRSIGGKVSRRLLFALFFIQLVAASMTMDRAPFFVLIIIFIYKYFSELRKRKDLIKYTIISLVFMISGAGIITNLQYNITSFSFFDVIIMGFDFFIHRTWLVPSIAPIELSFSLFDISASKLHLQYSRLGALVTGNYVGTSEVDSIFVTPVGAVGDIWRNFGFIGLIVVAAFIGCYFKVLDRLAKKMSLISLLVGNFLVIALCFYWVMGVFFSQGAFFTAIVCFLFFSYEVKLFRSVQQQPHND